MPTPAVRNVPTWAMIPALVGTVVRSRSATMISAPVTRTNPPKRKLRPIAFQLETTTIAAAISTSAPPTSPTQPADVTALNSPGRGADVATSDSASGSASGNGGWSTGTDGSDGGGRRVGAGQVIPPSKSTCHLGGIG